MSELLKLKEQYPEEYEQLKQKDLENLSKDLNEDLKAHYESLKIIDQLT